VIASTDQVCAVAALVHRWSWFLDHGQPARVADLLTDDAVVVGLGPDRHGPDGMRAWVADRPSEQRRRTQHQSSNLLVEVVAHDQLAATSNVVLRVTTKEDGWIPREAFVGEYRDDIVFVNGVWRFRRREVVPFGA
jgi:ketosteroid isomerase-like protein